jgi:hypothetical protein
MTTVLSKIRHLARAVGVLGLSCYALPGFAAPDWDIVGIRLGMTEQEARAAIVAHSAQAQISEETLNFRFTDGARHQETPRFLATIRARVPTPSPNTEEISLEFSPPPQEQRVVGVRRGLNTYTNPPPLDRLLGSLTQKYGTPLNDTTGGSGTIRNLSWAEADKALCGGERNFFTGANQMPASLQRFHQWQQQQLAPADLSQCGAQMRATMNYRDGGASVTTLAIEMKDYGYLLSALVSATQWLADLEAEAKKARLDSTDIPLL